MQVIVGNWADHASSGSVDSFYRQALLDGVGVQYEHLMLRHDPKHAQKHRFWMKGEAERAQACLSLIGGSAH